MFSLVIIYRYFPCTTLFVDIQIFPTEETILLSSRNVNLPCQDLKRNETRSSMSLKRKAVSRVFGK